MPDSSSDRDPLDRLAEEFVARFRTGERPSIEDYARKHPELAADIRDLFPALVEMEQLKPVTGDYTQSGPPGPPEFPADRPAEPTRVGEFRILRRVGVGGMGVVYEAVQESLGRHVALKLLPPDALLDAKRLERFRREARAAAGLHHTNIVPVFGTGEADGRHFYAMQFISGHPLDAVVDEVRRLKAKPPTAGPREPSRAASAVAAALVTGTFDGPPPIDSAAALAPTRVDSSPPPPVTEPPAAAQPPSGLSGTASESGSGYWVTCARLAAQVADALAYAHGQGVLHRDIKPSNLLLDGRGTLWITDFGLAKSEQADNLTQAGDIVGTLRYMAPERFDGSGDARADVYALGLTLYELLTLTPAFDGSTRAKLVEQALAANPPKPRQHDPAIPRDLETIVLKCIARDPALRYQTAAELAADLRRYIEDRPILARRASNTERAWRWCRRNPAVAALLGVAMLLLTVIAVGGIVLSLKLNTALEQAKGDRDTAVDIGKELRTERDKLVQAEKDRDTAQKGSEAAWQSLVSRIEADVRSDRPGRRVKSLATIGEAARIDRPKLRDLATAALALADLELVTEWDGWREDTANVAFDASFRTFARADRAGGIEVCRLTDRGEEVIQRLPPDGPPIMSHLYLSPDGRFLAYSRGGTTANYNGRVLCVRDLAAGGRFVVEGAPCIYLYGAAFSPTGRELAVSQPDGYVARYALPDGKPLARYKLPIEAGYIAYDWAGERLAAASGSLIPVFDLRPGRESSRTLTLLRGGGWLEWRPDGRALAYGGEHGYIHQIDPETGVEVAPAWEQPHRGHHCPRFTPAGDRVLSTNHAHATVCVWDAHTGRVLFELAEQTLSFDRRPAAGAAVVTRVGGKLRLWRLHPGDELRVLPAREGGTIASGGIDPTGRLLAAQSRPGTFDLFDLATGAAVASGAWLADDLRFVPAAEGGWRLFGRGGPRAWPVEWHGDRARVGPFRPVGGPPADGESPCVSADGALKAFAAEPGHIRLVESRGGRFVAEVSGPTGELLVPLHFAPDGGRLVARNAGGTALYVWDLRKIRGQLKALDLDWEWPDPPAAPPPAGVRVEVAPEDLPPPAPPPVAPAPAPAQPKPQLTVYDVARLRLAFDPWAADARLTLAYETFYAGRYEEARAHFTLAALGSRAPGEALAWRGHAALEQDRWHEAVADYNEALRLSPHFWGTQIDRARAYQKLGRHADAVADLSAVLKLPERRKDPWLWHLRSVSLAALGRKPEAELDAAVAKALVTADVAKDLNGRAWARVVRPSSPRAHDFAEDLARLAVGAEPRNPLYINTLGVALLRTGKYSEAAAVLYAGWALDRGAAAAFDLYPLAMCHSKLSDEKRAKEFFARAVTWHESKAANLSPEHAAELTALRSEAAGVLGVLAPPPRPAQPTGK